MNSKEILNIKNSISESLVARRLKDAIEQLMKLVVNTQDWKNSERLSELETNYKYMLHYQFEGAEDSQREILYNNMVRQIYEMMDDAVDELLLTESSTIFYQKLRSSMVNEPVSLSQLKNKLKDLIGSLSLIELLDSDENNRIQRRDLSVKRERIGIDIFNKIFISARSTDDEEFKFIEFLNDLEVPALEKSLFISALTLNIIHKYDSNKVKALLSACENQEILVRQRAIVGLIICLQIYDSRWILYPECKARLDALAENKLFKDSVLTIIKQLIRSRETEAISKKLTEEIIPEMMKFNSLAGKKLNMEDLMGETDFMDKNPDWKKELENSGLANKLQEYSSLQMEGADVFHSTFSSLKSFSFFGELSNWFLPFDTSYSELQSLASKDESLETFLQQTVLQSSQMCNSDKYSFALSLLQIPASQRQLMASKLGEQTEQLKELQNDAQALNPKINEEAISNQYIQDLYRFFKLYPYRDSFKDIFNLRINFYDKISIVPLISDENSMRQIANFCFDKNFFKEALPIYQLLANKESENESSIWQRVAYCKQMLNDLEGALEAYLQAELFAADNTWVIKRIAQVYKSLKDPAKALEYYQRASQLNPDNLNLELNIGHCYLDLGEYDKALNTYFKVELLDNKSSKAYRPIAWTAFLLGKYDLAQNYYERILSEKSNMHDYLNAGHVQLCLNNKKRALEYYVNAVYKVDTFSHFLQVFNDDKKELLSKGVDINFLPLLLDSIRYKLD